MAPERISYESLKKLREAERFNLKDLLNSFLQAEGE